MTEIYHSEFAPCPSKSNVDRQYCGLALNRRGIIHMEINLSDFFDSSLKKFHLMGA